MILTLQRQWLRHVFIIATCLSAAQVAQAGFNEVVPVPRLVGGTVSEDGHIRITWNLPKAGAEVELQQAQSNNFKHAKTVYHGPDGATFISGLENGTYYYRLRVDNGTWSEPVALTVQHHSLRLALILCSLGAVVFALTVFVVVKGTLKTSTDQTA